MLMCTDSLTTVTSTHGVNTSGVTNSLSCQQCVNHNVVVVCCHYTGTYATLYGCITTHLSIAQVFGHVSTAQCIAVCLCKVEMLPVMWTLSSLCGPVGDREGQCWGNHVLCSLKSVTGKVLHSCPVTVP